jgi:hypothetical protein
MDRRQVWQYPATRYLAAISIFGLQRAGTLSDFGTPVRIHIAANMILRFGCSARCECFERRRHHTVRQSCVSVEPREDYQWDIQRGPKQNSTGYESRRLLWRTIATGCIQYNNVVSHGPHPRWVG